VSGALDPDHTAAFSIFRLTARRLMALQPNVEVALMLPT
jgi:hypothetical protein